MRRRERSVQQAPGRHEEDPHAGVQGAEERAARGQKVRVEEDGVVDDDHQGGQGAHTVEAREAIVRSRGLHDRVVEGHRSTLTRSGAGGKQPRLIALGSPRERQPGLALRGREPRARRRDGSSTASNGRCSADERWVVLGANGAGKTSLLRIASLYQHPVVGHRRRARPTARSHRRSHACASASRSPRPRSRPSSNRR